MGTKLKALKLNEEQTNDTTAAIDRLMERRRSLSLLKILMSMRPDIVMLSKV